MKKVTVAVAMMAAALAVSAASAADVSLYSSRAALFGARDAGAPAITVAAVVGEHSTRWALLAARKGTIAEPRVAVVANYSTKAALRGERAVEFELAPLK